MGFTICLLTSVRFHMQTFFINLRLQIFFCDLFTFSFHKYLKLSWIIWRVSNSSWPTSKTSNRKCETAWLMMSAERGRESCVCRQQLFFTFKTKLIQFGKQKLGCVTNFKLTMFKLKEVRHSDLFSQMSTNGLNFVGWWKLSMFLPLDLCKIEKNNLTSTTF